MMIAEFIEQRLVEWEKAAKAAEPRWAVDVVDCPDIDGAIGGYAVDHVMLNDPARALRQCAAFRAIVADHSPDNPNDLSPLCIRCVRKSSDGAHGGNGWPCVTVRAVAAIWSDHPDYQQEWKP